MDFHIAGCFFIFATTDATTNTSVGRDAPIAPNSTNTPVGGGVPDAPQNPTAGRDDIDAPQNPTVGRDDPGAPNEKPAGDNAAGASPRPTEQTAPFTQGSQSGIVMLTPLPLLKKGSKGGAVWAMQTLLSDRGYGTQGVDSDFGANTESALKRFQTDFGLEADGECGCLSWEKLINGG